MEQKICSSRWCGPTKTHEITTSIIRRQGGAKPAPMHPHHQVAIQEFRRRGDLVDGWQMQPTDTDVSDIGITTRWSIVMSPQARPIVIDVLVNNGQVIRIKPL